MPGIPHYHLDSNILLRFILGDHKELSPRAAKLIQQANQGKALLHVSAVAVTEVFYVMKSFYRIARKEIARDFIMLLRTPAFHLVEHARIMDALSRVQSANVDFADAYLVATAAENGKAAASFDRDLDRFGDIKRHEP